MSAPFFAVVAAVVREASALQFSAGLLALALCAGGCATIWLRAVYRARLLADMPTAKLRSAAQGYVELEGRARMMPGEPVYAPLSGMPCVWYRYAVEQTGRNADGDEGRWSAVDAGVSEAIFHLDDGTGVCVVDPDGAEVTPSVRLCWRGDSARPLHTPKATGFWFRLFSFGAYRYTECRLHDGDPVYAIGQFSGAGGQETAGISEATGDLLVIWKRDPACLLRRFDRNRDGKIDMREWEAARQAAEQEVMATWQARQQQPETNVLRKPPHGRPYILSAKPEAEIIAGYRRQALAGALGLAGFGWALAWVLLRRFG
ncbi:MAG: GIDE domain-containing protein [Candidatus Methylumidiphilus sp.]